MSGWENTLNARIARREHKWKLRAKYRKQFPKPNFPGESKRQASPRATAIAQIPAKDPILHAEQSSRQDGLARIAASPATTMQTRDPSASAHPALASTAPESPTGAVTFQPQMNTDKYFAK